MLTFVPTCHISPDATKSNREKGRNILVGDKYLLKCFKETARDKVIQTNK